MTPIEQNNLDFLTHEGKEKEDDVNNNNSDLFKPS